MERTPCTSSQIKSHGYDPDTKTLEIEFNTGAVYQYPGVPQERYDALCGAPSIGKAFGEHIKGKFEFKKIG